MSAFNDPRSVIVFAPPRDERRERQLQMLLADPDGARERDVLIVDSAQRPDDAALRAFHDVADDEFAAVLIGRDGAEQQRWSEPVAARDVWRRIDATPMRRAEVNGSG